MTYGDVAEYCHTRAVRMVGRVLAADGGTVPWHRVLRADGTCAEHLYAEQRQRLIGEGVRFARPCRPRRPPMGRQVRFQRVQLQERPMRSSSAGVSPSSGSGDTSIAPVQPSSAASSASLRGSTR